MEKQLLSLVGLLVAFNGFALPWAMQSPHIWSQEKSAANLIVRTDGSLEIRHGARGHWAVSGQQAITVKEGMAFRLDCASEALSDAPGRCDYSLSVILRDAANEVMSWNYGERRAKPGASAVSEFLVPPGAVSMEPRITGLGRTGVVVKNIRVESLESRRCGFVEPTKTLEAETESLKVSVSGANGAITVTDRRTNRVWKPIDKDKKLFVTELSSCGQAISMTLVNAETIQMWGVTVMALPSAPEVLVTVSGDGDLMQPLDYPYPFMTKKGDRLIVPMNEGISFPVDEPDGIPSRLVTYGGHGVSMSFFGVQDDWTGAGYMGIVETADDAALTFRRLSEDATYVVGTSWEHQKGLFGYARRVRYIFLDAGGYVAMCKRYRSYVKAQGKFKSFSEKVRERPLVDRLLGAPNIWSFVSDKVGMARKLKDSGIERFLWSAGGSAEQVAELAKMDGVLVSRYDVYRDIYRPEQLQKLGMKGGTNTDAWPDGAAWNSADSNDWRKAWGVRANDGTWTYCACMCDAASAKYCREHVGEDLKSMRYTCRFIDVTTAAAWDTCFNPAHPMTRSDSRRYRMDLLRILGDEYGLVVGSETGHDAAVPYCDYFEGMLSLCKYRVPDSGRNLTQIWTNVPPNVAKFQVGAAYRLPLWELVYHECLCAHWYWGDYNNKLPLIWDERDMFNVLYGTMGMYFINEKQWEADKERFVRSYRITSPVARKTGYSEMLDHRILSPDRLVQQSVFANGVTVTVNFSDKSFVVRYKGKEKYDKFD